MSTLDSATDGELVKKAKKGDNEALAILIKRYLNIVFATCRQYLKNSDEADDATQETFVKVWRNLKRLDETRPVKPWFLEIAKNTSLDLLRKKRPLPFVNFESADGTNLLAETLAADGPSPLAELAAEEQKEIVNKALARLPDKTRKVLELYYNEGLNFREIGEALHKPLHTVKSRHRRALVRLRMLLDPGAANS